MMHNDLPQREQHRSDVGRSAVNDRIAARLTPDSRVILEPGAFVGRASKYGDATIGNATSSVTVSHNFGIVPHASQIHLTNTNSGETLWVTDIDDTQMVVHRTGSSGDCEFSWEVNPV